MREHQKQGAAWRFLQDLQDGIGRIAVEIVGGIDDDDAPVTRAGCLSKEVTGAADLVNGYRRFRLA